MNENFDCLFDCLRIFTDSYVNKNNELIIIPKGNIYFRLDNIENELDLNCKILEYVSRAASKGMPYNQDWRNKKYQKETLNKINYFLKTDFTEDDIDLIYTYLGNGCNHELTIKFVKSNYDLNILKKLEK